MEKLLNIVKDSFEDTSVQIIESKKFDSYDGFDSLTAMVLVDALAEHYDVHLQVEEIGEMTYLDIKDRL